MLVEVGGSDPAPSFEHVASVVSLPFVIAIVGDEDHRWHELGDLELATDDPSIDDVITTVQRCPRASVALALLLRGCRRRTLADGIVAESATYSMLQAGPEFEAWRENRQVKPSHPDDDAPRVALERVGDHLRITLTRPHRRNAFDSRMRDELLEALHVAELDRDITRVELRGEGPSFCSGGDLDEFGQRSDPATAHVVRLHRHVGRAIATIRDRIVTCLHGPCAGSGIEMAAFSGRVVARSDAMLALPEISLGLIPGAGGTVSLPARIGRHRTAWLALSGRSIDASTALDWGLVDELS